MNDVANIPCVLFYLKTVSGQVEPPGTSGRRG